MRLPVHSPSCQLPAKELEMRINSRRRSCANSTEVEPPTRDAAYFEPAVPVVATVSPKVVCSGS
jgi:hypothetical protein